MTRPGESIVEHGVSVLGPLNVPSMVPYHASQMYSQYFLLYQIAFQRLALRSTGKMKLSARLL